MPHVLGQVLAVGREQVSTREKPVYPSQLGQIGYRVQADTPAGTMEEANTTYNRYSPYSTAYNAGNTCFALGNPCLSCIFIRGFEGDYPIRGQQIINK